MNSVNSLQLHQIETRMESYVLVASNSVKICKKKFKKLKLTEGLEFQLSILAMDNIKMKSESDMVQM